MSSVWYSADIISPIFSVILPSFSTFDKTFVEFSSFNVTSTLALTFKSLSSFVAL